MCTSEVSFTSSFSFSMTKKLNHPAKKITVFLNPKYSMSSTDSRVYRPPCINEKLKTGSYFKGWEFKRRCLGIRFVSKVNLRNVHVRILCLCTFISTSDLCSNRVYVFLNMNIVIVYLMKKWLFLYIENPRYLMNCI